MGRYTSAKAAEARLLSVRTPLACSGRIIGTPEACVPASRLRTVQSVCYYSAS